MRKFILLGVLLALLFVGPVWAFQDGPWGTQTVSYLLKSAAPGATDSNYSVSTMWIDTTNGNVYVLMDNTENAAQWLQFGSSLVATRLTTEAGEFLLTETGDYLATE